MGVHMALVSQCLEMLQNLAPYWAEDSEKLAKIMVTILKSKDLTEEEEE